MAIPRLVISGLSGGAGKTTVSLGLARAFVRRNLAVAPFKKGPDYVDTAWLGLAARRPAGTLDPFFFREEALLRHFLRRSAGADIAVIEGNRGYFDGRDIEGSASTAEVARFVDAPVLLVMGITKMTRTAAAVAAGCRNFPGGGRIAGVVLNYAGSARHAAIARRAVEELAHVPVLGVLPRLDAPLIQERRSGLITAARHADVEKVLDETADFIGDHVDIGAVFDLARAASPLAVPPRPAAAAKERARARIGVARDAALWQYYEENLDALREAGAELVFFSLLDGDWPEADGLYLGGGDLAPYAAALAGDSAGKRRVLSLVESGMPVYAEHAGYFYLCETFFADGVSHAMAGVFPVATAITAKPARLGYMEAELAAATPFYPAGCVLKGHEYHYATVAVGETGRAALRKKAGGSRIDVPDGLVYKSAFGTSMQIFAPAVPGWAPAFVGAAARWRAGCDENGL